MLPAASPHVPIPPAGLAELVNLVSELFEIQELEEFVLFSLGGRLFVNYVPPGLTGEGTVFRLLEATEKRGTTPVLLRKLASERPGRPELLDAIRRWCPAGVPAAILVTEATSDINDAATKLAASGAGSALVGSRPALAALLAASVQVDRLGPYKELHEILHKIQFGCFYQLEDAVRGFRTDRLANDSLADLITDLSDRADEADRLAGRLPDTPDERGQERDWVAKLREAVGFLKDGRRQKDESQAGRGFREIRRLLKLHPARLNEQLGRIARRLSSPDFLTAFDEIATVDPTAAPAARSARAGLDHLRPQLDALISVHSDWQRLEPDLWELEGQLRTPTGTQWADEVRERWDGICDDAERLAEKDPGTDWAEEAADWRAEVDRNLRAPIRPDEPKEAWYAFRDYRRVLVARFFAVDTALKDLCGDVIKLGDPLRNLVRGLPNVN